MDYNRLSNAIWAESCIKWYIVAWHINVSDISCFNALPHRCISFLFILQKNKINNKQLGAFIHEDSHLYVNHFGVIYNPFINIRLWLIIQVRQKCKI